ncbi:olfactory receptor 1019-like [Hyla sarda]|uniref:olfactory receptor 1019-like n=1 Tax=Hyla sarda TaxID=327740 RepID=UPI0024C303F5|nr:olfactory receptor 1019-like [Hyla sarda]
MKPKNQTLITELILVGFTMNPKINAVLFVLFFIIYIITFTGNSLIILLIITNAQLHKPMYFFLCVLSVLDLCYSTTALPKLLADLFSTERIISVFSCATQIYVILLVEGVECQLLALMSYDRYVAICRPLHYPVLMRWGNCYKLLALVFILSFILCTVPSLMSPITICSNRINHFMCEMLAVLKLSCDSISSSEFQIFSISFVTLLLPLMLILLSYASIISSVLKIRSAGRSKAFSTCTSHLAVVALYFGTAMLMYFGPSSMYSTDQEKYSSIFYVIVSPMLNPLIYSLNNREVKESLKKVLAKSHQ